MTTLAIEQGATLAARIAGLGRARRRASERRRAIRATIADLRQLGDHQLRDIGLSRDRIAAAAHEATLLRR